MSVGIIPWPRGTTFDAGGVVKYPDVGGGWFTQQVSSKFASPVAAGLAGSYADIHGTFPANFVTQNPPTPAMGANFVRAIVVAPSQLIGRSGQLALILMIALGLLLGVFLYHHLR